MRLCLQGRSHLFHMRTLAAEKVQATTAVMETYIMDVWIQDTGLFHILEHFVQATPGIIGILANK